MAKAAKEGSLRTSEIIRRFQRMGKTSSREASSLLSPMSITPDNLSTIPLFRGITGQHLEKLTAVLERSSFPAGHVLFRAGDVPEHFLLLVRGEVTLKEGDDDRFRLRAVAPIGELGALMGLPRNADAVTASECEVWRAPVAKLVAFFEAHGEVAYRFYHNLLGVVSDKVSRDRRRLDDMRQNLIRTQKKMKALRDVVLESPETPISKPVCDALDDVIENNRRAHYRVAPVPALPATARMDDGTKTSVVELSDGYLKLELPTGPWPKGTEWSAVLAVMGQEMAVSGRVERAGPDGVVMKLDLLIDPYKRTLEDYVTRLQLLDYVV